MSAPVPQLPQQQQTNTIFGGNRITPTQTRFQSTFATQSVSNLLKSSLGPKGIDKMLVNEVGEITVTNDGATILKLIDIADPIARLLSQMSRSQDDAAGDGTTSVAIISAELIKHGVEMIGNGVHPSIVTSGFIKANKEAAQFMTKFLSITQESYEKISNKNNKKRNMIIDSIITSLNSKSISNYSDYFSSIVAEAAYSSVNVGIDEIKVFMRAGGSVEESQLLDGFALSSVPMNEKLFDTTNNNIDVKNGEFGTVVAGKVVLCSFSFTPRRLELGVKVNLDDPRTINLVKQQEIGLPLKIIRKLKENGIVGIISNGSFSKEAESLLAKLNMFGIKRTEYSDLHKMSKMMGSRIFSTPDSIIETDFTENVKQDTGDVSLLNFKEIQVEKMNVDEGSVLLIRDRKDGVKSILLKGPNQYVLSEVERSIHDALCVSKKLLKEKMFIDKNKNEDAKVVAGGGSTECAISAFLNSLSNTFSSRIRIPIKKFGEALMVIPETLAINAGLNVAVVTGEMKKNYEAFMERVSIKENFDRCTQYMGVGSNKNKMIEENMLSIGVVEPLTSKMKQLELATETALTILRVDECIQLYPKTPIKNEE